MSKAEKKYRSSDDFFREFMPNYRKTVSSIEEITSNNHLDVLEGIRVGKAIADRLKEALPKHL